MSTASQGVAASTEPHRSFFQRSGWFLLVLLLMLISAVVQLAAGGVTIIGLLFEPLLIGLMFLLPPRFPALAVLAEKARAQVQAETRPLLFYALLFPVLLIPVVIWGAVQTLPLFPDRTGFWALSWNYLVVGKIVLLFLPAAYFLWRFGGSEQQIGLRGVSGAWRWVGPFIIFLLYVGLSSLDYLGGTPPSIPLLPALAVIVLVFFAAGFTEEVFYRVLLQTRLEVLVGRWNGIAIAAFFFALLHLPSRFTFDWAGHTGNALFDLGLALTSVMISKGITGFALGYLWSRYHNLWLNVLIHTFLDALPLVLLVAGAALTIS